ncbi:hypothetical protein D4R86_04920 [bacterium]|nr:MAG: hypothetical protein D4R86_04920 [bacterium]
MGFDLCYFSGILIYRLPWKSVKETPACAMLRRTGPPGPRLRGMSEVRTIYCLYFEMVEQALEFLVQKTLGLPN